MSLCASPPRSSILAMGRFRVGLRHIILIINNLFLKLLSLELRRRGVFKARDQNEDHCSLSDVSVRLTSAAMSSRNGQISSGPTPGLEAPFPSRRSVLLSGVLRLGKKSRSGLS